MIEALADSGRPAVDLLNDDCNCGAPGFACPPGFHCEFGVCVPDHGDDLSS